MSVQEHSYNRFGAKQLAVVAATQRRKAVGAFNLRMAAVDDDVWVRVERKGRLCARRRYLYGGKSFTSETRDLERLLEASPASEGKLRQRFNEIEQNLSSSLVFLSVCQYLRSVHASWKRQRLERTAAESVTPEHRGLSDAGKVPLCILSESGENVCDGEGDNCIQKAEHAAVLCCYGLGNLSNNVFLPQLGFASLLRKVLGIPTELTWVSDPAMGRCDHALVRYAGLVPDTTFPENYANKSLPKPETANKTSFVTISDTVSDCVNACAQNGNPCTIYLWMPHCDQPVYGEVLRLFSAIGSDNLTEEKNQCPPTLGRCILMGNDLAQYDQFQFANFYRNDGSKTELYMNAIRSLKHFQQFITADYKIPYYEAAPTAFHLLRVSVFGEKPSHCSSTFAEQQIHDKYNTNKKKHHNPKMSGRLWQENRTR